MDAGRTEPECGPVGYMQAVLETAYYAALCCVQWVLVSFGRFHARFTRESREAHADFLWRSNCVFTRSCNVPKQPPGGICEQQIASIRQQHGAVNRNGECNIIIIQYSFSMRKM